MPGRTPEEREAARLERERKRGNVPPPPAADPATAAPTLPPENAEEPPASATSGVGTPSFRAETPRNPGLPPENPEEATEPAEPSMPPEWDGNTAATTRFDPVNYTDAYTEQLAEHYEEPPPPPAKVSHGHMLSRAGLIAVAIAAIIGLWFLFAVFQPFGGGGKGEGEVPVTIPKGADVGKIGELLAAKDVVSSARIFGWRANWSGKSDEFKAGRYTLGKGMSYGAAIDQLAAGPNAGVTTVTIPEGRSRYEIAQQAEDLGLQGDYMAATESSRLFNPRRYGAPSGATLEGFLFPATYEVPGGANVKRLVPQQLQAFKTNIAEVNMRYARSKNLTVYDVLTIASLIDREVSEPSERKVVASVIYNRLKNGIALGIDATSRFETRNWTEPLTNATLQKDTPYNTRINKGLPPGPIGNPGLAAIRAAALPANTDYLFYVANPCKPGTHTFTKTNAEFEQAVERYNKAREAAGGKQPSGC